LRSLFFVGSTQGRQPDLFAAQLDLELIAGLEIQQSGIGLTHHQVAVELHLGGEAQFAAALTHFAGTTTKLNTLGIEQGLIEGREVQSLGTILLGGDVAAGPNDVGLAGIAKVKELGDASKSELVRECGYVSSKKGCSERLNFTAFYEALLEAKGLSFNDGGKSRGKAGRALSYMAKVQFNGNLLVGKAYTAQLDLQPGDEFEIKLGRKQIQLIPIGGAAVDEE
jgi:hypothetical protein